MKNLFLLTGVLLAGWLAQPIQAQTLTTIGAARAAGPAYGVTGSAITVTGIVTNGAELGAIRYFQDGTGGVGAYGASTSSFLAEFNNVKAGDSIVVSGTLVNYKGLLEINPITALTVVASNKPVPEPVVFAAGSASSAYAEKYEGQLVRLNGQTSFTTISGGAVTSIAGGTSYIVSKVATDQVFVNAASTAALGGLIGQTAPTSDFDIIGIMSQYGRTVAQANSGYQLLPRLAADLVLPNLPNFASQPYPTDLATTSFTVKFATQNAGDTHVAWGLTPTDLTTGSASSADATTAHSIALIGLQPATVYYVQVSSTNSVGTSRSLPMPMITVSQSSGRMRAYFDRPVDVTAASPATNQAVYAPNGSIADTLARYIGRATKTLDIAIYNFSNLTIQNAISAAVARNVRVRLIYDAANSNTSVANLKGTIATAGRVNPSGIQGIMHNKFVVIDAASTDPNVPIVWTGSTNWTAAQLSTDRNSAIVLQDQSLARVYTMEFEEMWGGSGDKPGTVLFGANKVDNTPHYLRIGGKLVQSWFSPSDNVNAHIIETAQTADNDLHFASMQITRSDIAQAISNQITLRGIDNCSEGMTDDTLNSDGTGTTTRIFRRAIGDRMMVKPKGAGYTFHHKYMLVDAGLATSDPTLLVGSHNWSAAANSTNDENTLIIHDNAMVNQYYQEFVARIPEMNKSIVPCTLTLLATRNTTIQQSALRVYPNPARGGSFSLNLPATAARTATVTLRDVLGRVAFTQTLPLTGTDLRVEAGRLPAGVYLVQLVTPEATQMSRVVVE